MVITAGLVLLKVQNTSFGEVDASGSLWGISPSGAGLVRPMDPQVQRFPALTNITHHH